MPGNRLKFYKLVNDPAGLQGDCVYLIRNGSGFDLKVSDSAGQTLFSLNCCDGTGGTTRPYKAYVMKLEQQSGQAPVITHEFENDTGIQLTFEYQQAGRYIGHMQGALNGSVVIFCNAVNNSQAPVAAAAVLETPQTLRLSCAEDNTSIWLEIRAYE